MRPIYSGSVTSRAAEQSCAARSECRKAKCHWEEMTLIIRNHRSETDKSERVCCGRSFEGHFSLVIRMVIDADMWPVINGVCVTVESLSSVLTAALVFSALLDSFNGSFIPMGGTVCVCMCVCSCHQNCRYQGRKYDYIPPANQTHKCQGWAVLTI